MDLTTTYMGMNLKNPIVASASPLSRTLGGIRHLEDAGAAAVVLFSLFEEQIVQDSMALDHFLNYGTESYAEASTYLPEAPEYHVGPDDYLGLIARARESVGIPIIGSLNGISRGGWTRYAALMEEAGASALELNIYYIPTSPEVSGAAIEHRYLEVLREVRESIKIPIAVKIGPYFSSLAHMAHRFAHEGAAALTLFNRFYQPDFDLENLDILPSLELSRSYDLRLPLHWAAILYGSVPIDIAITSGVHSYQDVLKAMMAGANVAQMASELLAHGLGRIDEILDEMARWMTEYEYSSIRQMQGSMSQRNIADPSAYERANYMKVLHSFRPDPTAWLV